MKPECREKCRDCRFYFLEEETITNFYDDSPRRPDEFEAECRRFPPVRGDADYYGNLTVCNYKSDCFSGPIVNALHWCGEFKRRDCADLSQGTDVRDLDLTVRTERMLLIAGITTVEQLSSTPKFDLFSLPGFGHKALKEVESALSRFEQRFTEQK